MKKLKIFYEKLKFNFLFFLFILSITIFISVKSYSSEVQFEIEGNDYTDSDVILSLLTDIPESMDKEYANKIIKSLIDSNLFSDVQVKFDENKYLIIVKEYPIINNIDFKNNERLDDEDLEIIAQQINFNKFNPLSINLFINEIKKTYESFGYNEVEITYSQVLINQTNTVDIFFNIDEGEITKINQIIINGNDSILAQEILQIIKSKTKTIRNIFANNNYKPNVVERDKSLIQNYYKNNGFLDIFVESRIEYLKTNRVNIYFDINEGVEYTITNIKINDQNNILRSNVLDLINFQVEESLTGENIFSLQKIQNLKKDISSIIIDSGIDFFEINSYEKTEENKVEVLLQILPIKPKYTKQINIIGNNRTFDNVIRRELGIAEGDAIHDTQIQSIRQKLISLNLFESVKLKEEVLDENNINLIIEVEEKQTGTFNAGVSVGTIDGFAIVTGLRERNFYGTGRSLDILLNTTQDRNQFKLITSDRLSYENDADISYNINYKQEDFSKASSYKLDTFSTGIGIGYKLNRNLIHNIDLEYVLKDYTISDSSTVSSSIASSSGSNMSYLFKNNLRYSTLNSGFIPKKGNYINFNNTIETPTSSSNGYVRNLITVKKYYNINYSIFSMQGKIGNIFSLNNKDILTDDKFALGGRWLRGFDTYGAGPRNSRTSYVGGNNIIVTKLDYSYEITKQSNFPFFINIFNDYGLIWDNKTTPTKNDNNLRASAGFGIKYYSPIGPIGFTWGFPLMDEEYDIKRMFLFSIGNID
ncbi:outer membrane protein assembly factor BamA [Pelagibacteraceae bacterium]|nr:outer membrane protein assembly factor BamA [Pelagibacteraceae bacterium]